MSAISGRRSGRCVTADVDLGALADGYRHRPVSEAALSRAGRAVEGLEPGSVVLDIGGGPGAHAAEFANRGMRSIVVDPAAEMIQHGSQGGASRVLATAQQLPFGDGSVSLVYFHLSIHYGDLRGSIREAARVLVEGGRIRIWTMTPDYHRRSYLARWFPTVGRVDAERFPAKAAVVRSLRDFGFSDIAVKVEEETNNRDASEWVAAVRAGFVSTLQFVPDDELEAGLSEFGRLHGAHGAQISYVMEYTGIEAILGSARMQLPS